MNLRGRWLRRLASIRRMLYELLAQGPAENSSDFSALWHEATSIANREGFLHWEVAFPGVWHRWQESRPQGGFDAIIGNPPWDQIEQPEVEWFATRDEEIALATTGARRKALIKKKQEAGDKLVLEYEACGTKLRRCASSYVRLTNIRF